MTNKVDDTKTTESNDGSHERRTRRHFTAAEKADIVRRLFTGTKPAADVAREHDLSPVTLSTWVRQALDALPILYKRKKGKGDEPDPELEALKKRIVQRERLILQLTSAYFELKSAADGQYEHVDT